LPVTAVGTGVHVGYSFSFLKKGENMNSTEGSNEFKEDKTLALMHQAERENIRWDAALTPYGPRSRKTLWSLAVIISGGVFAFGWSLGWLSSWISK
jgi:hypothetical protein